MFNLHFRRLKLFIPALAVYAALFWIALALVLCGVSYGAMSAVIFLYILIIAIAYYRQHNLKVALFQITISMGIACAGLSLGGFARNAISNTQSTLSENTRDDIQVQISNFPVRKDKNYRCEALVLNGDYIHTKVYLNSKEQYENGQRLSVEGMFKPYTSEDKAFLVSKGIVGQVKVFEARPIEAPSTIQTVLNSIHRYMIERIDPSASKSRALMAACVMGVKTEAKATKLTQAFSNAGLAHILAVSGAHLVVLMYLIDQVLLKFKLIPYLRVIILALSSGIFVLLCSAPISAVRAWVMYVIVAIARLYGRRLSSLTALSFFVVLELISSPLSSVDIGFCFSVLAVASLTMFAKPFSSWLDLKLAGLVDMLPNKTLRPKRILYRLRGMTSVITASLVVMTTTAPLSIGVFGVIHPLGVLSNIVVAPIFVPYLQLCFITMLLAPIPYVFDWALAITDIFGSIFVWIVEFLSKLDFMSVPFDFTHGLILLISVCVVYLAIRKPGVVRVCCLSVLVCLIGMGSYQRVSWSYWAPARIVAMDVGQGDSILIQEGSTSVLVDAGPPNKLVDALRRNHVYDLDAIFITHLDLDHYAGVIELPGNVSCHRVYVAQGAKKHLPNELREAVYELTGQEVIEIVPNSSFKIGKYAFQTLWPQELVTGEENEHSLCMLMSYDQNRPFRMLLTGDLEKDQINQILSKVKFKVDILKVGHHGSKKSTDDTMLTVLKPKDAIISCGQNNDYGHPSQEVLEVLDKYKVNSYITAWSGDISVYPNASGYQIVPQKDVKIQTQKRAA